jgi:LAO/AO transport system kinase
MQPQHDEGVFVRSVAAHGGGGGLAEVTPAVIQVMKALGRDIIMLETVGIGQAEIDIAALSDSCVLVLNPGSGDDIQMLKAGILEAADILVVNKADSGGADDLKRGLEFMLNTRTYSQGSFKPPIVLTEALYNDGIPELAAAILMHREFLAQKAGQSPSTVKGRR